MQLDKLTTVFSVAAICAMNLMLTAQDYHHHDPHTEVSFFCEKHSTLLLKNANTKWQGT